MDVVAQKYFAMFDLTGIDYSYIGLVALSFAPFINSSNIEDWRTEHVCLLICMIKCVAYAVSAQDWLQQSIFCAVYFHLIIALSIPLVNGLI